MTLAHLFLLVHVAQREVTFYTAIGALDLLFRWFAVLFSFLCAGRSAFALGFLLVFALHHLTDNVVNFVAGLTGEQRMFNQFVHFGFNGGHVCPRSHGRRDAVHIWANAKDGRAQHKVGRFQLQCPQASGFVTALTFYGAAFTACFGALRQRISGVFKRILDELYCLLNLFAADAQRDANTHNQHNGVKRHRRGVAN